jgi:hypothetical protein
MGLHEHWPRHKVELNVERKPTDAAIAEEVEDCIDLEAKRWTENAWRKKKIVNEREYRDSNNVNSLSHPRTSCILSYHKAPFPFFINLILYLLPFLISHNMLWYICMTLLR